MNYVANRDLLAAATFAWRMNVKAVHPKRALEYIDSAGRFHGVGAMNHRTYWRCTSSRSVNDRRRRADSRLLRRADSDPFSLQRTCLVSGKQQNRARQTAE